MRVSQETHLRAVTIMNAVLDQARTIWKSKAHLFTEIELDWAITNPRTSGCASYRGGKKISLNPDYINNEPFWNNTIKHEVAHHLQKWIYPDAKQSHGPEFRLIMKTLGGSIATHHQMSTPRLEEYKKGRVERQESTTLYICPTCEREFPFTTRRHNKIRFHGAVYTCNQPRCKRAGKPICIKSHFRKEVEVKDILKDLKTNLVDTPTPAPVVKANVVGPAKLSDIIGSGWWNS